MRIERRTGNRRQTQSLEKDLVDFLEFDASDARPCGSGCQRACPTCGSTSCQCVCSPDCEHIPTTISTDPERHPIEAGIAPLVYVLQKTGPYHPCWSCEGHMDVSGKKVWKIPRVWFYCSSTIHVRLLADVLQDFRLDKVTRVPWQVNVSFSEDANPDTTFSLHPNLVDQEDVTLENLQRDVRAIADHLESALQKRAKKILECTSQTTP